MNVDIELTEPVTLTFSLKYLVNFCKASGLSSTVKLCLSNEVPLLVEYTLAGSSYVRFYLAPKVILYQLLCVDAFTNLFRSAMMSRWCIEIRLMFKRRRERLGYGM
jgi:DNA polymerase III sliding clamp (beta) subunit (PCNA family)